MRSAILATMSGWRSGKKKSGAYSEKMDLRKNAKSQSSLFAIDWSLTLHSFSDAALWTTISEVKSYPVDRSKYNISLFSKAHNSLFVHRGILLRDALNGHEMKGVRFIQRRSFYSFFLCRF